MKIKRLFLAALAALSTTLPAQARVDSGTQALLAEIQRQGITLHIDSHRCKTEDIYGSFIFAGDNTEMHLCPANTASDDKAAATVRHEAMHAIQRCININRGTAFNTPVLSVEELRQHVNTYLSSERVEFIKRVYQRGHWLIEFEAALAEEQMSADQIRKHLVNTCGRM